MDSTMNKDGQAPSSSDNRKQNRGNFKHDPERAREAGRKGGSK